MRWLKLGLVSLIGLLLLSNISFGQTSRKKTTKKKTSTATTANTNLTDNEISGGLKEALLPVRFAVESLGRKTVF